MNADRGGWLASCAFAVVSGCAGMPMGDEQGALAATGDAARGREVFVSREAGHCVLCHAAPGVAVAGNVGPSLAGVGSRLSPAQIRFRVADITRLNPEAVMPAFHRTQGLERVAAAYAGRPVLDARQVEDVVAFLSGLR
ncbi:MAG: sulfur oxidation c-type cytochrome SoxX [Betaproteobacteria bacterium]|nr:sulfur oxidation c-type cytochrome SoxX [Betaproteobacteria bacterium]